MFCVFSCFSRVQLFVTLWTVDHQAPLSMGFSTWEFATPSSRGSSQPRDGIYVSCVSCFVRRLFIPESSETPMKKVSYLKKPNDCLMKG